MENPRGSLLIELKVNENEGIVHVELLSNYF